MPETQVHFETWERGAPDVAVEIVSPSDAPALPWAGQLARYQSVGVRELVRFDPADDHAAALRVTQSVDSDALVPTRKEARQAAERRVPELEAELRRRS